MRIVHSKLHNKKSKKKVDKFIDSILKESEMTRGGFNEVKKFALEMKASGQTKVITTTPIAIAGPLEGVTVAQPSAQTPIALYVVVAQVKLIKIRSEQSRKQ